MLNEKTSWVIFLCGLILLILVVYRSEILRIVITIILLIWLLALSKLMDKLELYK